MKMLLACAGILVACGLVVLSSIALERFFLQLVWMAFGASLLLFFLFADWRSFFNHQWVIWGIYGASLLLLGVVLFAGPVVRNVRGWIFLGPIHFQPVELAKIALIFAYASYFARRHISIARWRTIATSFAYFAVLAGLVALQPDLGSALVLFGIWAGFLLVSGLPRGRLILLFFLLLAAGIFMWQGVLKDYQRARIVGVLYPERDVLGINYSVSQSKIAIGSAGFLGKGYGQGSQTQLGFLTEPDTDFIFAALVEEWGWAAGIAIILVFVALIWQILKVGFVADRNFEKFICLGVATVFSWQFFLNLGSATGIFPVVGVTFPFLSYGGSSLLTSFFLLAIVNAIALRS